MIANGSRLLMATVRMHFYPLGQEPARALSGNDTTSPLAGSRSQVGVSTFYLLFEAFHSLINLMISFKFSNASSF